MHRWEPELGSPWQPSGHNELLSLPWLVTHGQGTEGPQDPPGPPRGRRPQGTCFQVRCLNGDPRGVAAREVGNVHVEAPDHALHPQPDDAPVVTCGTRTTGRPSPRGRGGAADRGTDTPTSRGDPSARHRGQDGSALSCDFRVFHPGAPRTTAPPISRGSPVLRAERGRARTLRAEAAPTATLGAACPPAAHCPASLSLLSSLGARPGPAQQVLPPPRAPGCPLPPPPRPLRCARAAIWELSGSAGRCAPLAGRPLPTAKRADVLGPVVPAAPGNAENHNRPVRPQFSRQPSSAPLQAFLRR